MDIHTFVYHDALAELSRTARAFASAIEHASEAAAAVAVDGDDMLALRTFAECNRVLVHAFAKAPGMVQVLTGAKDGA